jgi:hypothetical protein
MDEKHCSLIDLAIQERLGADFHSATREKLPSNGRSKSMASFGTRMV